MDRYQRDITGSSKPGDKSNGIRSQDTRLSSHEEDWPKEPRCIEIHESPITSLVFLADGKHVVSGCKNGSIRRWRVSDWCEIEPAMKSDSTVNSVAVSSDGKWIVSGGDDRKVTIWNAASHQKAGQSAGQYETGVTALDIAPDSSSVATGLEDGSVFVWRLASREHIAGPWRHQHSQVSSVKFSPAGDLLALACTGWGSNSIRIWDSCTGDLLECLPADTKPTYSLAWTIDGQRLFAGGPRGSIRCFNIASLSHSCQFWDQYCDSVTSLCISNNDRFLVAGSASGCSLSLWDVKTLQRIRTTPFKPSEVQTVTISPDDQHLVIGTVDKKIFIWSLSDIVPVTYFFHCLSSSPRDSEPFTYISKAAHEAWKHRELEKVEEILSAEIANPNCPELITYSRANRAFVRARLGKWDKALEDAQMPNDAHIPPIAYIAKGFALFGQGKHQEAKEAIDLALCTCDDNTRPFVELINFIILFEMGHHDEVEVFCYETDTSNLPLASVVKARMLVLLAECSMIEQNYAKAIQLLTKAQDLGRFFQVSELRTISLIFGWDFDSLDCIIQQQVCTALFASGRTRDAIDSLHVMQTHLKGGVEKRKKMYEWLDAFKKQCVGASESLGEDAMRNGNHDDAIAWYSAALDLNPALPEHVFMKRSDAYAAKGSWENALMDANEVIGRDASHPLAHEMKCRALRKLKRYDEIIKAFNELPNGQLHDHHTLARAAIDETVKDTLHNAPLRMIDTKTGHLCEEARLKSEFESDPVYGDLVVSTTECMDAARIKRVVKKFFGYVMLSHRWQGKEPLCSDVADVEDKSVYNLPTEKIPMATKLQTFCRVAGEAGYRWAWSDTCCIDQKNQREFEKSINSMFRWYHHSSLTLVYLYDILSSSRSGGLTGSAWITRGWTLQELLAPTVIRFYTQDWTLYLFDLRANHKESDVIIGEIAKAVGVPARDLRSFRPSSDEVRWKLHMASRRDTTVPEDSAYCLFGIFNVVMPVIPGEPQYQAVGRLLREVITCSRSGDVGCLAWVGKPSELCSWLPADIKVYREPCHTPVSIGEEKIQRSVAGLEGSFTKEHQAQASALYDKLECQRWAECNGWHLRLPCIAFHVTAFKADRVSEANANVYIVHATALEGTRVRTADKFPAKGLLLVCPWIHELLDLGPPRGHHHVEESTRPHALKDEHSRPDCFNTHHENPGLSTPSSLLPSPSTPLEERTRALRFIARLGQPVTALLLSKQRHGVYKRVATDHEIVIKMGVSLDDINIMMVEII